MSVVTIASPRGPARSAPLACVIAMALAINVGTISAQTMLAAGSLRLHAPQIAETVEQFEFVSLAPVTVGDTSRRVFSTYPQEQHAIVVDGQPAVLLISGYPDKPDSYVDSLVVRLKGLAPIWEHQHYNAAYSISFAYDGSRVRLERTGRSSAPGSDTLPATATHAYALPMLAYNELDLVVRSLPFASRYSAIVPLYSEGSDELELDTLSVVKRDRTAAGAIAWTVRFAEPKTVVVYVVDDRTRAIVDDVTTVRTTGVAFRRRARS